MFFEKTSRRHFLQGLGAGLLLPHLPSLLPEARAQAAATPRRYVQVLSTFGTFGQRFFPADATGMALQGNTGVHAKPLSAFTGDLSNVLGPAFTPLKAKLNVVRGLNVLAGSSLHNGSYPTCASGTNEDNNGNGRPIFPWSIDAVLAGSNVTYPDPTGKQRHVVFAPQSGSYSNYSWWQRNGATEHVPNTNTTAALLSKFAFGGTQTPTEDPKRVRQRDVIQGVFADYQSLRDGGKLSAADKGRLEAYMQLVSEVQRDLAATPKPTTCEAPAQEQEANVDARHRNQIKVLAAALACDLTRVASYVIDIGYEPMHTYAHGDNVDAHAGLQRVQGQKVAMLIAELDKLQDAGGGTVLDNSLVYWGNEFGEIGPGGDAHVARNMPVVTAGGCGGMLNTGYYIDYRMSGRRPMNNLLVTFFNALGLKSADYQKNGVVGFGEYNQGAANAQGLASWLPNAERVKPLAFLYKGPTLG